MRVKTFCMCELVCVWEGQPVFLAKSSCVCSFATQTDRQTKCTAKCVYFVEYSTLFEMKQKKEEKGKQKTQTATELVVSKKP